MVTNLKRRLQVILVTERKVLNGSRSFHRLHGWAGLFEVSDVLGISHLPTTAVLTRVCPRQNHRRL